MGRSSGHVDTGLMTFTSDRERRLWLWSLAVVVAIFSTLGLTRTLAGAVRDRGLIDDLFFWAFVATVVAIVAIAVATRPGMAEIGVGIGTVAVYLMVFLRMATPEERSHLVEYGVLAVLVYEALTERAGVDGRIRRPALLAIAATSAVGVGDEMVQAVLPFRVFDPIDIVFNVLAVLMAIGARLALGRARRQRRPMSGASRDSS